MDNRNQWLIELSRNEELWAKELDAVPSMIKLSYDQLKRLAEDGQVYGVMLQCKDLFEVLYKIPIVMVLIVLDSDDKYKEGTAYADIIRASLGSPMSMGLWNDLASVIVKKSKELSIPGNLISILKKTRKLYATDVTPDMPDVIKWRNDAIGHGALKFQDDEAYQQEVKSLILLLKEYFDGTGKYSIKGLYDEIYFELDDQKLVGDTVLEPQEDSDLRLFVSSEEFEAGSYVDAHNLRYYLFDSFYCRKDLVRYRSYLDGQSELLASAYFSDLFAKHVLRAGKDSSVQAEFISREEDIILEYLNMPISYIKPLHLVEQLTDVMDDIEHGVIALFMERGTGKSAFSNQMSGLYHKSPLIKNSFSRCYHVQNAALRGVGDFINSVIFSFRHSFDSTEDFWGSTDEMPTLSIDSQSPAEDMARFLNYYHKKYRKEYTILLIDGIDEMAEQTRRILEYVPSADQLDDGVFVVLLSRFQWEDTVLGNSKQYIEFAETVSQAQISLKREDEENIRVLTECINQQIKAGRYPADVDFDELIRRADYRFLYLKAYLAIKAEIVLENKDEYSFIRSYMDYILSFYGPSQKRQIKEIAVAIALFPSISIRKYQEYMNCIDITYEFVGLFNDLDPIMTVLHVDGENVYVLADAAYADYILEAFSDVVEEVLEFFDTSLENRLKAYLKEGEYSRYDRSKGSDYEEQLNQAIIFYSEGIIGLWNRAHTNQRIRTHFFENHYAEVLCDWLLGDVRAVIGYISFVREELCNCLSSAINYCIQNQKDTVAQTWCKIIFGKFHSDRTGTGCFALRSGLTRTNDFEKIYNYILDHHDTLDLEDWLWALVSSIHFSDNTLAFLESKEVLLDKFLDYVACDRDRDHRWITEKLPTLKMNTKQEEYLLNLQLQYYYSKIGFSYENEYIELLKECLETIRLKEYAISDTLFSETDKRKIRLIEKGEMYLEERKKVIKKIKEAVDLLQDYETPWNDNYDGFGPVFRAYNMITTPSLPPNTLDPEDIEQLHSAVYERMCYERDNGDFAFFAKAEGFYLSEFIVEIIKNEYGEGEEYFWNLTKWIDFTRNAASNDNGHLIALLSAMMIEGVEWLKSHNRDKEAEELLTDYILHYDTKAFFFHYRIERMISAIELKEENNESPLVYCTRNVIYLLDYYFRNGFDKEFRSLMSKIENDVPLIDACRKSHRLVEGRCEVEKFKFMKYRKEIGYSSKFDEYLDNIIKTHKGIIEKSLHELSRNSDFKDISFHVVLLLEYVWQTQQWDEGKGICDDWIRIFSSNNCYDDPVVEQFMGNLIALLEESKNFFLYLNNEECVEMDLGKIIWIRGLDTWSAHTFLHALILGQEESDKSLSKNQIKLNPYGVVSS